MTGPTPSRAAAAMKTRMPRTMRAFCAVLAGAVAGMVLAAPVSPARADAMACVVPPATSPIYAGVRAQTAQTPRGPLAYYRFGQGSPILLVTGFGATLTEWNATFLAALAQHHQVIVFDNRGVGRSIPDATSFTVGDMAQDTAALIAALRLPRPTVIGWSMGGAIVQQLAIEDAPAIGRAVLLSAPAPGATGVPAPAATLALLSGAGGATFHGIMALLFPPASVSQAEQCFVQEEYKPADYEATHIPRPVIAGQLALLAAWGHDDAAATALRTLRLPVLVLSGDADAIVSDRNALALRRLIPAAQGITIAGSGHAMMYQDPVSLAGDIDAFARH